MTPDVSPVYIMMWSANCSLSARRAVSTCFLSFIWMEPVSMSGLKSVRQHLYMYLPSSSSSFPVIRISALPYRGFSSSSLVNLNSAPVLASLRLAMAAASSSESQPAQALPVRHAASMRLPLPQKKSPARSPSSVEASIILFISSSGFWVAYPVLSADVRPTMSMFHTSFMLTMVYQPFSSLYSLTPLNLYGFLSLL